MGVWADRDEADGRTHPVIGADGENRRVNHVVLPTIFAALIIPAIILTSPIGIPANDSVAGLGAGGIELVKTEDIRILEEVLEISPHNVRVKYRFFNETDQDIRTAVAFPLPPFSPVGDYYAGAGNTSTILKTFQVRVNGRRVATEYECKAILASRDITGELRKLGLSDNEIFFRVGDKDFPALVDRLGKDKRGFSDWWNLSETVFWTMTFSAKKETLVEHEYAPVTGWGAAYPGPEAWRKPSDAVRADLWTSFTGKGREGEHEDCLDEATKRAVENRLSIAATKGGESVRVEYYRVEYVLGTGRNWKGPIGEFTLRLVKEKPDQFVSLCFPGEPRKISPTIYEFSQKDYVPQDTLVVYFYTVQ